MHISGRRPLLGSKDSWTRNAMQVPSRIRRASKIGLPWGGLLGICIIVSISANIVSLTLNQYQVSLINQMTSLDSASIDGVASKAASAYRSMAQVSGSNRRHLSASSGSSSGGSGAGLNSTGASSAACSSSASSHGGHSGPHPHDALLYLFNALVIGVLVMQISARYQILQQTIVLFMIGFIGSLLLKGLELIDKVAIWGDSYEMWMQIDPHLLLFTLLPALLAGDAMTIDTSVAKRVGMQCLYLAGPGVVVGAFSTALFLNYYIQWESEQTFLLSLCAGSILCATDPVAVVALLKELGASPVLTVQIQGESLLNDGTAIVIFLLSYNMLSGIEYDALDIVAFLVEKALMAFAIGIFIGYFFFAWIRCVSNKFDHNSSMIQITLSLCCAYWSFIFVEGILSLSGVLATVASSLVLAHHMWPYIVSPESMHHVWHTFESLGNIIVFFLAGSITGFIVLEIDPIDWLHLLVIYIVLLVIRATLLFCSRPILQFLNHDKQPVTWQDACLMVWGGLRGAVGLALAIQVNNGRAPNDKGVQQINPKDAERILFFVSGIAFLTTLVNASTAPLLVTKLEITALPSSRKTLLKMFHHQLVEWSHASENPDAVTASLEEMLGEAAAEIDMTQVRTISGNLGSGRLGGGAPPHTDFALDEDVTKIKGHRRRQIARMMKRDTGKNKDRAMQSNKDLVEEARVLRLQHDNMMAGDDQAILLLGGVLPDNLFGKVEEICRLIRDEDIDTGMSKVVNQCFLTLVYNNYWEQISEGRLRPGGPESDMLLTSVRISLSPYHIDLADFAYVQEKTRCNIKVGEGDLPVAADQPIIAEDSVQDSSKSLSASTSTPTSEGRKRDTSSLQADYVFSESTNADDQDAGRAGCVSDLVHSMPFNIAIAVTILLNSVMVGIEELARQPDDDSPGWLVIDTFFSILFLTEFLLKFASLRCRYFSSGWNRFDFFLVLAGVLAVVLNFLSEVIGSESSLASETRVIRLGRVLRTMRFLRLFRLFNARLHADRFVSVELATHMTTITTMKCFIFAHIKAQNQMLQYFGGNGEFDEEHEVEIARCILQSQVSTYKALKIAADIQQRLGQTILAELASLYQRMSITEGLSKFVEEAQQAGAISALEAHAILEPLHHQVSECMAALDSTAEGVLTQSGHVRQSGGQEPCQTSGHDHASASSSSGSAAVPPVVVNPPSVVRAISPTTSVS